MGCILCGRPAEVHHCIHDRYSTKRRSNWDVIPLCPEHHRIGPEAIHTDKEAWREKHGPDYSYLPIVMKIVGRRMK